MQRGCSSPFVKLPISAHRLIGAQALDRDPAPLELRDHIWIGVQAPIRADAQNQPLRKRVEHIFEVLHRQRMPIPAPFEPPTSRV